ncbi:MAG: LLM class flavin-dependent oxidoreductase [Acidimicrobiia bacterium]|nr:LLM class flavin-dependent oxidoreductase [Acidimicrobiia bacterium]
MPRLSIHYDLRHPQHFGVSGADIYAAALDQIAWADANGFERVGFGEHHQSPDGYIPSPLVIAGAVGAVTTRIRCLVSTIVAPLHDPIRLAEDIAVADNCLGGRLDVAIAAGYVRDDFALFGKDFADRGNHMERVVPLLRQAWTGEPFEHHGTTVRVTPRPVQDPMPLLMGGSVRKTINRAARLADGFRPPMPVLWEVWREERQNEGHPDPGPLPRSGPIFLWVTTDDKERTWDWLEPHILHQVNSYAGWTHAAWGRAAGPFIPATGLDDLRQGGTYQVLTPDETIVLARSLGDEGELRFSPLLAGIDPARARPMLELVEREVLPAL